MWSSWIYRKLCLLFLIAKLSWSLSPPVLFLPGFLSSRLYATVEDELHLPATCEGLNIPIGEPFLVLINASLAVHGSDCMFDILTTDYDAITDTFSSRPGITVTVTDFGGFKGIELVYWPFAEKLISWGYTLYDDLLGIPFDYRFMSSHSLAATGFILRLMSTVEAVYHRNGHSKVVLIGHSNGGPTMYSFFTSELVSEEWKSTYIAGMISLSGNFLGQLNMYNSFAYGSSIAEVDMLASWEASYMSCTWGGYNITQQYVVIATYVNTTLQTNYSPVYEDIRKLFGSVDMPEWQARLASVYGRELMPSSVEYSHAGTHKGGEAADLAAAKEQDLSHRTGPLRTHAVRQDSMNRTAHPLVNVHCLYGSELTTSAGYEYQSDILSGEKWVKVNSVDSGDGNQDIFDNEFCTVWRSQQQDKYTFEAMAFPGVSHMQMFSNDDVMEHVHTILMGYA